MQPSEDEQEAPVATRLIGSSVVRQKHEDDLLILAVCLSVCVSVCQSVSLSVSIMNVGDVRVAEDKDFELLKIYLSRNDGWRLEYDRGETKVWTRNPPDLNGSAAFKMIRVRRKSFQVIATSFMPRRRLDPCHLTRACQFAPPENLPLVTGAIRTLLHISRMLSCVSRLIRFKIFCMCARSRSLGPRTGPSWP